MTRAAISICILLALVGTGVFSGLWVERRCGDMLGELEDIEEMCAGGDKEGASEAAAELAEEWQSFRSKAMLVIRNDRLLEVDRLAARFSGTAGSESPCAGLTELKRLIEAMRDSGMPRLTRIL